MQIWEGLKRHFIPSEENAYRPKLLHRSWLLFFLALTLASEGFLVANLVARQGDQNFLAAVVPAEIVALTNDERTQNGVGQLSTNALLTQAAQAKADDMAAKGYFSHVAPDGETPWQWIADAGYQYQYAGENLAVQFVNSSDVVNAWMASPTHRDNIVKPVYTDIGVGVANGLYQGNPATYVVQFFATPLAGVNINSSASVAAAVSPSPAPPNTPAVVAAPPGQVEGAAVTAAPPATQASSLAQSLEKQLLRAFADPELVANWVLGAVATVIIFVLLLTFFVHVQIQPAHVLMRAAVVALFALSFLALNTQLVATNGSPGTSGVEQAASVGYALFP